MDAVRDGRKLFTGKIISYAHQARSRKEQFY